MKSIRDFLPKPYPSETILVQAKIDSALHEQVKEKMKAERITWNALMTAACKMYLEETGSKKRV